jgi:glutathione S-transferase
MKLFFHPMSQNARKVLITAQLLDVPMDLEMVDLTSGAGRQPNYLALNPNGKVPTLQDGSFVLWESNAICEYLVSKKQPGSALYPEPPQQRANVSRWLFWEAAHWTPTLFTFFRENMIKKFMGLGEPDPVELKRGREELARFGGVLNSQLKRTRHVAGDDLTLADIAIASHLMHAGMGQLPLAEFPAIQGWFQRIESLPAWQATQPKMA